MFTTNTLSPSNGSRKSSKRVWRGNGSGKGTFSGRWMNGQNSRSGGGVPDWFEGGQTPLFRRMPKMRGFTNARFTKHFNVVNLSDIEKLAQAGTTIVTKQVLLDTRLITKKSLPVKLLGSWELTQKVTITVDAASATAQKAVESAWGTLTISKVSSEEKK